MFLCVSTGTGGTIAGVSSYLKEKNPDVKVFLADPPGSSLYNKVSEQDLSTHATTIPVASRAIRRRLRVQFISYGMLPP